MFFPQHFVFGSPFLLSLSAYTCNAGTHDFYPPLSTGPLLLLLLYHPNLLLSHWICEKQVK